MPALVFDAAVLDACRKAWNDLLALPGLIHW